MNTLIGEQAVAKKRAGIAVVAVSALLAVGCTSGISSANTSKVSANPSTTTSAPKTTASTGTSEYNQVITYVRELGHACLQKSSERPSTAAHSVSSGGTTTVGFWLRHTIADSSERDVPDVQRAKCVVASDLVSANAQQQDGLGYTMGAHNPGSANPVAYVEAFNNGGEVTKVQVTPGSLANPLTTQAAAFISDVLAAGVSTS